MSESPLNPIFERTEKTNGKRSQHLSNVPMEVPDHYHSISETPIRDKIETWKNLLYEAYDFISHSHPDISAASSSNDEEKKAEARFHSEYLSARTAIKDKNEPATQRQEVIRSTLCSNVAEDLRNIFSAAFIWTICADLLEEEGLRDQSWASLVELASLEHRLELACMAEEKRRKRERQKKYGSLAYQDYKHLKEYLIEYLHSESKHGWETQESAAFKLAPKIFDRHKNSEHKDKVPLSLEETERRIYNWITSDAAAKKAYEDNKNF